MKRALPLIIGAGIIAAVCGTLAAQSCITSDFYGTRQCAVDALWRPDQVFHAVESVSRDGRYVRTNEVWYDGDNDVARRQEMDGLTIYHNGEMAKLDGENRLEESDASVPELSKTSVLSLGHIVPMFMNDIWNGDARVLRGQEAAYRVDVKTRWHGDWTGRQQYQIYLDKDCLPVRIVDKVEEAGPEDREIETNVTYDFIPRSDLPADFVSFGAISDLAVPPVGFLQQAVAKGTKPYWLGETFEGMSLIDVRSERQGVLELTYSEDTYGHRGWAQPGFLIEISSEPPDICPGPMPGVFRREVPVGGRTATLCQTDGSNIGLAGDQWVELLVPFDGTYVRVWPGYGEIGTNPYRNPEAMLRLAAALRPFEGPAQ